MSKISITFIEDVAGCKAGETKSLTRFAALDLVRKGKAKLSNESKDKPKAQDVKPPQNKVEKPTKTKKAKNK